MAETLDEIDPTSQPASKTYKADTAQRNDLRNRFSYHAPKEGQPARYVALRNKARLMALHIIQETPKCREQSLALTKLEEAIFWANAAIARNE